MARTILSPKKSGSLTAREVRAAIAKVSLREGSLRSPTLQEPVARPSKKTASPFPPADTLSGSATASASPMRARKTVRNSKP